MKVQEVVETKKENGVRFKLVDQTGNTWSFNAKKSIAFGRIFAEYGKKANLSTNKMRFLYKGRVLHATNTPEEVDLENNSTIEIVPTQVGGSSSNNYNTA